jgi:H+-transporting ATPase
MPSAQIIGDMLGDKMARSAVDRYITERASRGLRSLGVAKSGDEGATWELVGLISLLDPPRSDTRDTILKAKELGVEVRPQTLSSQNFSQCHLIRAS